MTRRSRETRGLRAATIAYAHPLEEGWTSSFRIDGRSYVEGEEPEAYVRPVMPGYFESMGIRVVAGRSFTAADGRGAPRVVILSQSAARRFWPP